MRPRRSDGGASETSSSSLRRGESFKNASSLLLPTSASSLPDAEPTPGALASSSISDHRVRRRVECSAVGELSVISISDAVGELLAGETVSSTSDAVDGLLAGEVEREVRRSKFA